MYFNYEKESKINRIKRVLTSSCCLNVLKNRSYSKYFSKEERVNENYKLYYGNKNKAESNKEIMKRLPIQLLLHEIQRKNQFLEDYFDTEDSASENSSWEFSSFDYK